MARYLLIALTTLILISVEGLGWARDPADIHPGLHLIPWPKSVRPSIGRLALTRNSRIVVGEPRLQPLAQVLAEEISLLTELQLEVTKGQGRPGDIVLKIDPAIRAGESILAVKEREVVWTNDGAHSIVIDKQATITGFDYRATAEGTATILQLLSKIADRIRLPSLSIKDWPHADYCGVMLDVARQDHPIDAIKKVVQLCRLYKARYLQLHLTDDQGWTFPSTKYPATRLEELRRPRRHRTPRLQAGRAEGTGRLCRRPRRDARAGVGGARPFRRGPAVAAGDLRRDQSAVEAAGRHGLHEHVERGDLSGARHDHRRDVRRVPLVAVLPHRQRRSDARAGCRCTPATRRSWTKHGLKNDNELADHFISRGLRDGQEARQEGDQVGGAGQHRDQGRHHHGLGWEQHRGDGGALLAATRRSPVPWNLGVPWEQWNMYVCNASQLKKGDSVLGATLVAWEQPPRSTSPASATLPCGRNEPGDRTTR